jgi:hypothetical protein
MGKKMFSKTKKVKEVGKIFKVGERTFYPIIEKSTTEMERYFAESISPLAFVIIEPHKKYILPLTEDEVDTEEIIELVFQ